MIGLQRALVAAAERHREVILPGYTHMQRAQPVLAPHYFLAYVEKLERDRSRLADCRKRLNVLPLGAAALAGTSLPIDRDFVADELGFDGVAANSLDVSSDRDFAVESVFVLTMIAEHLAGWAEEWILWSTQEFGFLALPDAICTGSSIMPQKKNPDVLELIRGRSARVVGDLTTLLVLIKGLPLAYNRDLQEDKEPLFDAFDTVEACLELAAVVVEGARLRADRIAERLDEGFLDATTLMEYLIERGVPQRTAHEVIGRLVGLCERRGLKRLADLSDAELAEADPRLGPEVRGVLGVENADQGVPVVWLDRAGRGGEAVGAVEVAIAGGRGREPRMTMTRLTIRARSFHLAEDHHGDRSHRAAEDRERADALELPDGECAIESPSRSTTGSSTRGSSGRSRGSSCWRA